jgi:malonyl-CoA decarboxylase
VTLSPVPSFAAWLKRERAADASKVLNAEDRAALVHLDDPAWWQTAATRDEIEEPLLRAAAWYFLRGRAKNGVPVDPVARFHLGNGARLERLNWLADVSEKGLEQSHGLMVNYLYELDDIEKNHEAYAQQRTVIAASAVTRLVKGSARDVVPLAG